MKRINIFGYVDGMHPNAHHGGSFERPTPKALPDQGHCPTGYVPCMSGHCLEVYRWCDDRPDCPHHDDERQCIGGIVLCYE
jgi:hypothetical protein